MYYIILHRPIQVRVSLFVENLFAIVKQMIKLTRLVEQLIADRAVTSSGGPTPYFNTAAEVISYAPDDDEERDLVRNTILFPSSMTHIVISVQKGLSAPNPD